MGKNRKKNKKQQKRKPRVTKISGYFTAPGNVDKGLYINLGSDEILIKDFDENIVASGAQELEVGYKRDNGKSNKVLNKFFEDVNSRNLNYELIKYDSVYAVDTNTRNTDDIFMHVGALIKINFIEIKDNEFLYTCDFVQGFSWKNNETIERPEQHTWYHAIEYIKGLTDDFENKKIGLVVDCDLGNLKSYNNKCEAYYDNFFVPENLCLIYASADVGSDELISNKAIKEANKLATQMIDENI